MSLIRKHGAVLQAWACLDLVILGFPCVCAFSACHHIPVSFQWVWQSFLADVPSTVQSCRYLYSEGTSESVHWHISIICGGFCARSEILDGS